MFKKSQLGKLNQFYLLGWLIFSAIPAVAATGEDLIQSIFQDNSVDQVQRLISEGADVNYVSPNGITPLWAALNGPALNARENLEIADVLIRAGANVNHVPRPPYWHSASRPVLHRAVKKGKMNQVVFLVERGADVNLVAQNGSTPLFGTVHEYQCWPEIARYLIEKGANVDYRWKGRFRTETPLDWAEMQTGEGWDIKCHDNYEYIKIQSNRNRLNDYLRGLKRLGGPDLGEIQIYEVPVVSVKQKYGPYKSDQSIKFAANLKEVVSLKWQTVEKMYEKDHLFRRSHGKASIYINPSSQEGNSGLDVYPFSWFFR